MRLARAPRVATAAGLLVAMALTACAGGSGGGEEYADGPLTVWTPQITPANIAAQEKVAKRFSEESGIRVEVVPMAAADQDQALATGAASGDVPDVMLHATDRTQAWSSQGLLDPGPATAAVENLSADTFNERALQSVTVGGEVAAVPSDGWTHVIAYRKDLFAEVGVREPTSLEELARAATKIKDELSITGMAMGTQSGSASATESIESIFQTTGCELATDGAVTIDSAECTEAAQQYLTLRNSSTEGDFDVQSAQAAYMDGQAGMLLFSTHILDELDGLAEAVPPTCEECRDDPEFLADNTEFVTVLDQNNPDQFATMLSYGVPTGANAEAAQKYIEYVMSTGYEDTLGVAAEGRFPLRNGTAENPTEYADAWGDLGIGPELKKSSREIYGDEFVASMGEGMNAAQRWGMGTPEAELAGLVFAQSTLAESLDRLYKGTDPAEVTAQMAKAVEEVKASL